MMNESRFGELIDAGLSQPGVRGMRMLMAMSALLLAPAVHAEPLYVRNLSPLTALVGLPAARSAATPGAGNLAVALHSAIANNYVLDVQEPEALLLDGETVRLALELRYGIGDDWDVQLELPWQGQDGGKLDSLIDDWHDFWGMPGGGRSQAPHDRLRYHYQWPDGETDFSDNDSGVGDISVALNRVIYRSGNTVGSLALGYKFGSGDEDAFLGSGSDDVYIAGRFSGAHLSDLPLTWHGQLGYLRAGKIALLNKLQERDLWFAGLALDWAIHPKFSLLAQVDLHAAPFDSELKALGDEAVMVSLGARWRFSPNWSVDASFVEDARVETAPDVTLQASLRYTPSRAKP